VELDRTALLERAVANADTVRRTTSPNPWVGAVVVTTDGRIFDGATQPPGGRHAEIVALDAARAAGAPTGGATVVVTLEPCSHHGRTGPCADALVEAGVASAVIGVADPDPNVAGRGVERLRAAGVDVEVLDDPGVGEQLAPYLHHRRTGRPYVLLKLAATLDGRTAAADGTSRWITGPEARADVHRLRAESDAILVGAGTVRADDPELTARHAEGADPLRVVLGHAPADARVHPCLELQGDLADVLDTLGSKGIVQLLVEGGPTVAGAFHRAGLVDRYVLYLAPALLGGDDARPVLAGRGAATIADIWRGRITDVTHLGDDLRIELRPIAPTATEGT
jgi:diaminohydroxyphosphoribosylaminopyrimidine deaminase/5-amino-6-(5-phosphoribosylamino)uracil reductase